MEIPVYYTLVEYEKGDIIGFIFAIFSLLPIFLMVSYVTLVLENFNSILGFGLLGQLLNEGFNSILKKLLAIQRPFDKGRGYGMPSSHAQFMGFTLGYFFLYAYKAKRKHKLYYTGLLFSGLLTSYSRVYLNYHTLDQVVIGFLLGIFIGMACGFTSIKCLKVEYKKIK